MKNKPRGYRRRGAEKQIIIFFLIILPLCGIEEEGKGGGGVTDFEGPCPFPYPPTPLPKDLGTVDATDLLRNLTKVSSSSTPSSTAPLDPDPPPFSPTALPALALAFNDLDKLNFLMVPNSDRLVCSLLFPTP
jgi:hypothetical protein